jgi:membrane-associated phospholipid phosphatase
VWLKAIGTPVVIFAFLALYLFLLKNPVFPVTEMPVTILDHVVGFYPPALLLYVTLWVYVTIPPALLATRRELVAYTWAIGGLCLVGLACFLFWPTAVPPPRLDRGRHFGFDILQEVDMAGNACPSLHAAAAVFSAIWLHVLLRELGAGRTVRAGNWIWGLGIVYSAMATKQHVAVDVFAGVALGVAAAVLGVRHRVAHLHPARDRVSARHEPVA